MALKSSREGLRKELVDYLGNLIVDDNLRNEIIKAVSGMFVTTEALNESVNTLTSQITTETGERIEADDTLQNNITAEATAREGADTTLQNNINAETTAREQAISNLEEAISNISSISPLIAYPIGSVYFSVNDINPSTILGGGTWELIGSKLAVRENVVGNGITLGLTNGSDTGGLTVNNSGLRAGSGFLGANLGRYGVPGSLPNDHSLGVPTKAKLGNNPEYSGLIVDTETIYSWKRTA